AVVLPIVKILLPILIVVLAIIIIRLALRLRRTRLTRQNDDDVRESLWSWSLFWTQLKAFLYALFGRFLPHRTPQLAGQTASQAIQGPAAVRNIREIYRAFLKRTATRGYARKKDETPYEFWHRLNGTTPLSEPAVGV